MITLIPLSILFTGASLETMKTTVVLTALPFLVILLVKVGGFIRWLKQDYADIPAHQVEHYLRRHRLKPGKTPVLLREPYSKATTERHHPNDKGIPMSNLSPDFVLPENFCANPQEAWTIPARFIPIRTRLNTKRERLRQKLDLRRSQQRTGECQ